MNKLAQAIPAMIGGQLVLILKEGTGRTRGKEAQKANIMAARAIAESVKSALGPKGMDKMLVDNLGDVTVTNDGATIVNEMEVQHPAAKMMVEVAKATDKEVGDGTTSAVILAGDLLKRAEELLDKGVHPTIIVEGYRKAAAKAIELLGSMAKSITPTDKATLRKVAITSVASKMVSEDAEFVADLAVEAVLAVAREVGGGWQVDLEDVKVEKKPGESMRDSKLIRGIALDKEVVHSGMPKRVTKAKIAILNRALEVEKTEFESKISIKDPSQMKTFFEKEQEMQRAMVEAIAKTGANVVLCQKGVDEIPQHYLAKKGIMAVRRIKESDMDKLAKATGGKIAVNLKDLSGSDLGYADLVEERKVGDDKWTFVEGCRNPRSVTILLRGGTEKVVEETERAFHDALSAVRAVLMKPKIVAGGGSSELETSRKVREWAAQLTGREQLAALVFADSLESIPACLAENAGLDPIDILVQLRSAHEKGEVWSGIEAWDGKVKDMMKLDVLEPLSVKEQVVKSANEAACLVLKVDDIIAAHKPPETGMKPHPHAD